MSRFHNVFLVVFSLSRSIISNIICAMCSAVNSIKLVGSGRMIRRNQPLYEQGIQNNQQIMAILLEPDGAQQVVKDGENFDMVQRARNDAATLLQEDDQFMDVWML